jgi:hypothetical protein
MGSFASWSAYIAARNDSRQDVYMVKQSPALVAGRARDLWVSAPLAGAAPTTAAAPTKATTGAITGWENSGGSFQNRIPGGNLGSFYPGVWVLCDRLSHQGGLSAVTTGAQTTNLPTSALTRYTSGDGVMMGLTIYTQIGTTGTTITTSYTNQAGTAGQASPAIVFGGTGFREAQRMLLVPLASGDKGVRAVANVNVLATTGTAGAFGVTLFKPLLAFPQWSVNAPVDPVISGSMFGGFPEILDDACLFWLHFSNNAALTDMLTGRLSIAEV